MQYVRCLVLACVMTVLIGCDADTDATPPASTAVPVQTQPVQVAQQFIYASLPASAQAADSAAVTPTRPGTLESVSVSIGQSVLAGQTLATLAPAGSSGELAAQLSEGQAAVTSAAAATRFIADTQHQRVAAARLLADSAAQTLAATQAQHVSGSMAVSTAADRACDASATGLTDSVQEIDRAFVVLDQLFGLTSTHRHTSDIVRSRLATSDPSKRNTAEHDARVAFEMFGAWRVQAGATGSTETACPSVDMLAQSADVLQVVQSALRSTEGMLRVSSSSAALPQADLDGYLSRVTGSQGTLTNRLTQIQQAQRDRVTSSVNQSSALIQQSAAVWQAQAALQRAQADLQIARADADQAIATAEAALSQAQARLSRVTASSGRLDVRAPFAGQVVDILAEAGEQVGVGSALLQLASSDAVEVTAHISEQSWRLLALGQELAGTTFFDESFAARLTERAPAAGRSGLFKIVLQVESGSVTPGSSVQLRVPSRVFPQAARVPAESVIAQSDGSYAVFVVTGDTAVQTPVQLLARDASDALIDGLSTGDRLVVSGTQKLIDGDTIRQP